MTFKAKMYLVGGVDDFEFTLSTEFASMKATVDAEKRSSTRAEWQLKCLDQLLQRAVDSLSRREQAYRSSPQDMGLAIHGIIALASTASTGKFAAGTRQGHSHQRNRESFKVSHATTRHSISSPSNVHSKEIRTSTELKFDLISQSFLQSSSTRATAQPKFSEHPPGAEEIRGTPKLSEKHVSRESSKQRHHNNN